MTIDFSISRGMTRSAAEAGKPVIKPKAKISSLFKSIAAHSPRLSKGASNPANPTTDKARFSVSSLRSSTQAQVSYQANLPQIKQTLETFLSDYLNSEPDKFQSRKQKLLAADIKEMSFQTGVHRELVYLDLPQDVTGFQQLLAHMLKGHSGQKSAFSQGLKNLCKSPELSEIVSMKASMFGGHSVKLVSKGQKKESNELSVNQANIANLATRASQHSRSLDKAQLINSKSGSPSDLLVAYYQYYREQVADEFTQILQSYVSSSEQHHSYALAYAQQFPDILAINSLGAVQLTLPTSINEFAEFINQIIAGHGKTGTFVTLLEAGAKTGHISKLFKVKASVLNDCRIEARGDLNAADKLKFNSEIAKANHELKESLQAFKAHSNLYLAHKKEFVASTKAQIKMHDLLLRCVQLQRGLDKRSLLTSNVDANLTFKRFDSELPVLDIRDEDLFIAEAEYNLNDRNRVKTALTEVKAKNNQLDEFNHKLGASTLFYLEKIATEKEVEQQNILGISPALLDIEQTIRQMEDLVAPPKNNWRTRLINFFFPKKFQREREDIAFRMADVAHLKMLRQELKAIPTEMSLLEMPFNQLADKPWMKFVVAKTLESISDDCLSYGFGPFKIASPFKRKINQYLHSGMWHKGAV